MNRRFRILVAALPCVALLAATLAYAQGFGWGRRPIEQNDPPPTEFVAARWHFVPTGRGQFVSDITPSPETVNVLAAVLADMLARFARHLPEASAVAETL